MSSILPSRQQSTLWICSIQFGTTCLSTELLIFFFSSRRRHTRLQGDWSSDVCSSDLKILSKCFCRLRYHLDLVSFESAGVEEEGIVFDAGEDGRSVSAQVGRDLVYGEIGRASCRERV